MRAFWSAAVAGLSTTTTQFIPVLAGPNGSPSFGTPESTWTIPLSEDITVTRILVKLTSAPGAGKSRTITFRDDAANTSAAVTISDTNTTGTWTGSVSVSASSLVCFQSTVAATPATAGAAIMLEYTTGGTFYLMPVISEATPSTTAAAYAGINVVNSNFNTVAATNTDFLAASSLTFTKLTAKTVTAPGASKSWALSLRRNNTTDSLTATITGTSATSATTTGSTAIVAGDSLVLKCAPTGTPAASALAACLTVTPANADEIVVGYPAASGLSSTAAVFNQVFQNELVWQTIEDNILLRTMFPAGTIKSLYTKKTVAPGSGKTFTTAARVNSVNSSLTAAITGTGTTANNTATIVTITDGDRVSLSVTPASTPAVTGNLSASFLFVYPPAAPSDTGAFFAMF